MTPDEQILKLLKDWSPEVSRLLDQAGYWDLPRTSTKRQEIAKKIGLRPGGKTYDRVLKAALEKNENISQIVLNEYSLREFKAGAREVAKQLNIPFSKYDWNDGAQEHFQEHGLQLVKNLSQTDLDSLRDRIQYDFNLDPKAFAKKYAESYSCSPARLERIKRTEAHTESQAGGYNFALQAEAETKTWNCHPRAIWPRPSHRAVWHEEVPIDKPFSNGLMWPSEVNCRCYLTYGFGDGKVKPQKVVASSVLSRTEAEKWAKDSAYRDDVFHATSKPNADAIRSGGFKPASGQSMGASWGNGIYTSLDAETNAYYRSMLSNPETLILKVNVKNPIIFDASKVENIEDGARAIAEQIGKSAEYNKARAELDAINKQIEQKATEVLGKPLKINQKPREESYDDFEKRFEKARQDRISYLREQGAHEYPHADALTQIAKDAGHDSIIIRDAEFRPEIGGNQMVIFDPKNIKVIVD